MKQSVGRILRRQTPSKKALVLWRQLTSTDFKAMNGQAAPSGGGGGAMHIALGVGSDNFPIQQFLQTQGTKITIPTQPWPDHHESAPLTFSGNPVRRSGEWHITDQYTNRHPAWTQEAGFPEVYDPSNPPYVLVFRVQGQYHVRFATVDELRALRTEARRRFLSDNKGIAEVSPSLAYHFEVPGKSSLKYFEEQQAEAEEQQAEAPETFDPSGMEDGRQKIFSAVLRRQGQRAFRRKLLQAYRNRCAITGCETFWVLEAAHISPYLGPKTNNLANGLILRADIHTLFDLGLISVEPATLQVKVSSLLHGTEYASLDGRLLARPEKQSAWPSKAALRCHFSTFRR